MPEVWSAGLSQPREIAMLAEIFMVQLEAAARATEQRAPTANPQFVPFAPGQFALKNSSDRLVETREKASTRLT
jgi:hypothetical protein